MTVEPGRWTIPPDHELPEGDDLAMPLADGLKREAAGEVAIAHRSPDVYGRPIDPPPPPSAGLAGRILAASTETRRPILSAFWRSSAVRRSVFSAGASLLWYRIRFHAWHAPGYLLMWSWWAIRGVGISLRMWIRWQRDTETKDLIRQIRDPAQLKARSELGHDHNDELKQRAKLTAAVIAVALWLTAVMVIFWQTFGRWLAGATLIAGLVCLVVAGKPPKKTYVTTATVTHGGWSRLTSERVRRAFVAAGIVKDPDALTFPQETVSAGPGQMLLVQLPEDGLAASEVAAKRLRLALAFRVPIDQLFVEPAADDVPGANAGLVSLLLAYKPVSHLRRHVDWPTWPLLAPDARTSWFEPLPVCHDIQFRPVYTELDETNTAIAGRSGSGKSVWLRNVMAAALLDPVVEVRGAEYKGVGDFVDAGHLMPTYICGLEDAHFAAGVQLLTWALRECDLRGPRLLAARLAGRAPDGKVTPELAADPGAGLHPILVFFDEIHELFEHPVFGATARKRALDLHRRGRAFDIHFIFATQIPDKSSIPPTLMRNTTIRVCCAVKDHFAVNMILGTGASANGWNPTRLKPKRDAGWAYLAAIEDPRLVRSYDPTREQLQRLYRRANELRGGRVVGAPIDDSDVPLPRDVIIDVEEVFRELGWDKAQWVELAGELAQRQPEAYAGITAPAVSADVMAHGVRSRPVKPKDGTGRTLRGCYLVDVRRAIERRQIEQEQRMTALAAGDALDNDDPADPDDDDLDGLTDVDPAADPDTEPDADPDTDLTESLTGTDQAPDRPDQARQVLRPDLSGPLLPLSGGQTGDLTASQTGDRSGGSGALPAPRRSPVRAPRGRPAGPDGRSAVRTVPEPDTELLLRAVELVTIPQTCSAAMLARKLKITQERAVELVDELEAAGVVGRQRPRPAVLVAAEDVDDVCRRIASERALEGL